MKNNIILITKDILIKEYLGCYGSKQYKTPNIDNLAHTGNLFQNYYTSAPSSAMAYISMFTGFYAHHTPRKHYTDFGRFSDYITLFDKLIKEGYSNHIIWDDAWMDDYDLYDGIFKKCKIHNLEISNDIGPHFKSTSKKTFNPNETKEIIINKINKIVRNDDLVFVWIHLPHVLLGESGYGSDIYIFDEIVGEISNIFSREGIFLSSDHGHMNLKKGINAYGFHLYEPVVNIPLITPRLFTQDEEKQLVSCTQLSDIILKNKIEFKDYIYADTQYYLQSDRKFMVRKGFFKYIFNKSDRTEELYDLKTDPDEEINLLLEKVYDRDRNRYYTMKEVHNYTNWEASEIAYFDLRNQKNKIWKEGVFFEKVKPKIKSILTHLKNYGHRSSVFYGRWGSLVRKKLGD